MSTVKNIVSNATKKLRTNAPFGVGFGAGGRSSNNGMTATVFGGNGFIGRYLMNELGEFVVLTIGDELNLGHTGSCGTRVYAPYRGCEMEVRHLKPMFDLGNVKFFLNLNVDFCLFCVHYI